MHHRVCFKNTNVSEKTADSFLKVGEFKLFLVAVFARCENNPSVDRVFTEYSRKCENFGIF
jgi:hypothetical protein